jgi:hypothetical protein
MMQDAKVDVFEAPSEPRFSGTGQAKCQAKMWLQAIAMGICGISIAVVLGATQDMNPLNDMDVFSADDDDTPNLLLTTILPATVLCIVVIAYSAKVSARFGGDMLQEMSIDMDPKDAARSCLTNAGLILALFLTMILAAWQQDVSNFDKRFAMWYRIMNLFAAECAIRGLVMCALVLLYMEPLDTDAAIVFACDNMNYLGEPITAMILCILYFVNVLILWEFGTDGVWIGIIVALCLGYSIIRVFAVFSYLASWKNPMLSEEQREKRNKKIQRVAKLSEIKASS